MFYRQYDIAWSGWKQGDGIHERPNGPQRESDAYDDKKEDRTYPSTDSTLMHRSPHGIVNSKDDIVMLKNMRNNKWWGLKMNTDRGSMELVETDVATDDCEWIINDDMKVSSTPETGNVMVLQSAKYDTYYYLYHYDVDYEGSSPLSFYLQDLNNYLQ